MTRLDTTLILYLKQKDPTPYLEGKGFAVRKEGRH